MQELGPRWVVGENVPNLVNLYLDQVLFDLESAGYAGWAVSIPACAFDAPHVRQRIFVVAYAASGGAVTDEQPGQRDVAFQGSSILPDANGAGLAQPEQEWAFPESTTQSGWWSIEPELGRVANGIPHRVDRLGALGNAVTPQQAEWIGRLIVAADLH